MNEHDKHFSDLEMTVTPTQAAPSQGRRRFVKGAVIATPAVMTLMSGRLAAAASSTCAERMGEVEIGRITDTTGGTTTYVTFHGEVKKTSPGGTSIITYDQAVQELAAVNAPITGGLGSCLASFAV